MSTETVYVSPRYYSVERVAGTGEYLLVVVRGGVAMHEVAIVLTDDEVAAFLSNETALDDLAYRAAKNESDFAERTRAR